MKKLVSIVLSALLLSTVLCSCAKGGGESAGSEDAGAATAVQETNAILADADMFTNRDYKTDYDESASVQIQLNGDSAVASSNNVRITGSTVTITQEATYIISGTLNDGMIVINAPDTAKIQLVLNGVNINSETSAALYILEADKVFITLPEGSDNFLSNGGTFTAIDGNNIDGAIFSKQDLTLNGFGTLTVTSPAGHGIVCKDDLVITGGTYAISSASHGLDANDSIRITGETAITIAAGKDGMHAENSDDDSLGFVYISSGTIDIEAEGDGITTGAYMQIMDGTFRILAGGGYENGSSASSDSWGGFRGGGPGRQSMERASSETQSEESGTSMKGIKASGDMLLSGGSFTIDSADDAVHSNASITVNGGSFEIATGDDAFHADESLTVVDGVINISTSYEGLEALHVDIQGGEITLAATDDGVNAAGGTDSSGTSGGRDGMFGGGSWGGASSNGSIVISGGTLYVNASGDGLDANGTIEISGGYITVVGPTQGDTATLDYDVSAVITGGTFIGTGASGMAQTFSDSKQGVISVRVSEQSAGTTVTVKDSEGNLLFEFTPELSFNVVIVSSPEIISGETYTITAGTVSGESEAK